MTIRTTKLPINPDRQDDRDYEVTAYDDMILIERDGNYMYEYESMALTKEQALYLAGYIMGVYGIKNEEV